jgi:futalosine hydrolase
MRFPAVLILPIFPASIACAMKILLVAATPMETNLLWQHFQGEELPASPAPGEFSLAGHTCTLLHTGVGMCNASFALGRQLALHTYDLAIQWGIAGSFDRNLSLGQVVEVASDCFAELGADSPEGFLDMEAMGFPTLRTQGETYYNVLKNPGSYSPVAPRVAGITVNRVSGTEPAISLLRNQWQAQVETMEGAAFFHAMLASHVPFRAFRGISNYVEPRDKSRWQLRLASENAQRFVISLLAEM